MIIHLNEKARIAATAALYSNSESNNINSSSINNPIGASRNSCEWVKVVSLHKANCSATATTVIDATNEAKLSLSSQGKNNELSTAKLVQILNIPISAPTWNNNAQQPQQHSSSNSNRNNTNNNNNNNLSQPLVQLWRQAGFVYSEYDASVICQVIVEFPSSLPMNGKDSNDISNSTVAATTDNSRYYVYPADKVYRLQAGIKPNRQEVTLVNNALQPTWMLQQLLQQYNTDHSSLLLPSCADAEYSVTPSPSHTFSTQYCSSNPSSSSLASSSSSSLSLSLQSSQQQQIHQPSSLLQQQQQMLRVETVKVRNGFLASAGYVLLAADYSQVELRILAHYCADKNLTAAFRSEVDVFQCIAARWKKKPLDEINTEQRNQVKQICYALIYGAGPALVAQQAKVRLFVININNTNK